MKRFSLLLILSVFVSSANAALISVLGGQAVYDTDQDISWIGNPNLAAINTFGLPIGVDLGTHPSDSSGIGGMLAGIGFMNWPGALFWIDAMNAANYLGVNDWRLPITPQPDPTCSGHTGDVPPQGFGSNCIGSEMGYLYNVHGVTEDAPSPFSNVSSAGYWAGNEFAPDPASSWLFLFNIGFQGTAFKENIHLAWAVRDGNIAAVPIPAAAWLFGSVLGLLVWLRRKSA